MNGRKAYCLHTLLILALLVQSVAAAGLSLQSPCEADSHAAAQVEQVAHPRNVTQHGDMDSHGDCCCDHGMSCNPDQVCANLCASLVSVLPVTPVELF